MKTNSVLETPATAAEVKFSTLDGNEAAASVAYRLSETIAIYPITPSSTMAEVCDEWSAHGRRNLWDTVPRLIEMQSEGGVAGAVHGMLQLGTLSTTFSASQGLLLMIPNMYKIAGELLPFCMHVTARTLATHALSIFGDHSDVMACRQTGFALLASGSVQEAHDFACIAHAATLKSRVPFLHFFDGFRTSHEIAKIAMLGDEQLSAMIDEDAIHAFRANALTPDRPSLRGTAQNPDVFFQCREACNPFYLEAPQIVQSLMDRFGELTGRKYRLFDYAGHPEAERVIVIMGSGGEVAHETADWLIERGEKVGVLKLRLFRPFSVKDFVEALPTTVRHIAVLDRTKEPGAIGEPLYQDVVTALREGCDAGFASFDVEPRVIGGRYGLSSKEFNPAMVKAVFDELKKPIRKNHFTVGIVDDVTHTSLDVDPEFDVEADEVFRSVFFGLGADGTVGANKNSIKIIGEGTDNFAQGYFVYDSKKSGAVTVSHLRFGPKPIRAPYLISRAHFVGCHQPMFLERFDVAEMLLPGGTLLLNSPHGPEDVWVALPDETQRSLIAKRARLFVIDARRVAQECGMGGRINTIMQVCFFSVSGVLPREEALAAIKDSILKTYAKKGDEIVKMNLAAVENTLAHLHEVKVPSEFMPRKEAAAMAANGHSNFASATTEYERATLPGLLAGHGDALPVSALPCDGTFPTGTARWEKRNLATEIPVWDPDVCIQCGKCVFVCPHAVIRSKVYAESALAGAPADFQSRDARLPEWKGLKYTLQVAPEDCTGCGICVDVCPAKNKSEARLRAINMRPQEPLRESERAKWDFFLSIPELDRRSAPVGSVRGMQTLEPLFEFSGACAGCGETPYLKLLSQLFGDRMVVANATGCSSIYGGNLPTTPWSQNKEGRGPAWCNSLFEDNAEFGLGFRVSLDKQREFAAEMLARLAGQVDEKLARRILDATQADEAEIVEQRENVALLKKQLETIDTGEARRLLDVADTLVRKSVWIIGGDGWAYDIGYGGLDHVLASGANVKVLVLDTEVYSNTGGQCSKSTPRGAVAKFAAGGKSAAKKDLGLIAMTYGNIYVGSVAMGAKDEHTLKTFLEAEAYDGPALIIAYSHCIAHGINMTTGMQNQKAAVNSARWLLYRFNPDRARRGENPLQLDSSPPRMKVAEHLNAENRFRMLTKSKPEAAKKYFEQAQLDVETRWNLYQYMAARPGGNGAAVKPASPSPAPLPQPQE